MTNSKPAVPFGGRGAPAALTSAVLVAAVVATACVRSEISVPAKGSNPVPVATFSLVGYDPDTGDLGVAVQSKFFAVGAVVPWARAGVGAVATQALANTTYGPSGLDMLTGGSSAAEAVAALTAADAGRDQRQLGIVDAAGNAASFTGEACLAWAGGRTGKHYAAQGNILAGPGVVDAMAETFEATDGDLADRLVAALAAGQAAGGDARGRQSATLLVVRARGGYARLNDRYVDLRVDDHPAPIAELRRLLGMRRAQLETGLARRLLEDGEHDAARAAATRATLLSPADSSGWLLLAAAELERGAIDAAISAGREAVIRDPWLKQSMLAGTAVASGGGRIIERLLEHESFARFWATIPARR